MWPKVFAQLVEILPHVARLIPMADMFFATKTTSEKANEAAIIAMTETVRTDLGKVTAAHESLYRQLQDQGQQIAKTADDLHRARLAIEGNGDRIAHLEQQVTRLVLLVRVIIGLALFSALLLFRMLLHSH